MMRNLDKYAAVLCAQFVRIGPCYLNNREHDCDDCELHGICHDSDKLLAFMMQQVVESRSQQTEI